MIISQGYPAWVLWTEEGSAFEESDLIIAWIVTMDSKPTPITAKHGKFVRPKYKLKLS